MSASGSGAGPSSATPTEATRARHGRSEATVEPPMTTAIPAEPGPQDRVGAWAAVGVLLCLAAWPVAFALVATIEAVLLRPLGWYAVAGMRSLSVRNASFPIVWGILVAAPAMLLAPRWVPRARFRRRGWILLGVGLLLAGFSEYLTDEFVRDWAGNYDPEYAGLSVVIPWALGAVALATWAALAVPRRTRVSLLALAALTGAGLALALASNLAGAADGIRAENVPIATVFVLDALFALGAGLVTLLDPGPGA